MDIKTKQTINDLKNFYIDHMIETYNNDWDKFWSDHEDIIELEYKCKQIITMYKFNHKVILKYAGQALVIGTTGFILAACVSLIVHLIQNGGPTSFGIYG